MRDVCDAGGGLPREMIGRQPVDDDEVAAELEEIRIKQYTRRAAEKAQRDAANKAAQKRKEEEDEEETKGQSDTDDVITKVMDQVLDRLRKYMRWEGSDEELVQIANYVLENAVGLEDRITNARSLKHAEFHVGSFTNSCVWLDDKHLSSESWDGFSRVWNTDLQLLVREHRKDPVVHEQMDFFERMTRAIDDKVLGADKDNDDLRETTQMQRDVRTRKEGGYWRRGFAPRTHRVDAWMRAAMHASREMGLVLGVENADATVDEPGQKEEEEKEEEEGSREGEGAVEDIEAVNDGGEAGVDPEKMERDRQQRAAAMRADEEKMERDRQQREAAMRADEEKRTKRRLKIEELDKEEQELADKVDAIMDEYDEAFKEIAPSSDETWIPSNVNDPGDAQLAQNRATQTKQERLRKMNKRRMLWVLNLFLNSRNNERAAAFCNLRAYVEGVDEAREKVFATVLMIVRQESENQNAVSQAIVEEEEEEPWEEEGEAGDNGQSVRNNSVEMPDGIEAIIAYRITDEVKFKLASKIMTEVWEAFDLLREMAVKSMDMQILVWELLKILIGPDYMEWPKSSTNGGTRRDWIKEIFAREKAAAMARKMDAAMGEVPQLDLYAMSVVTMGPPKCEERVLIVQNSAVEDSGGDGESEESSDDEQLAQNEEGGFMQTLPSSILASAKMRGSQMFLGVNFNMEDIQGIKWDAPMESLENLNKKERIVWTFDMLQKAFRIPLEKNIVDRYNGDESLPEDLRAADENKFKPFLRKACRKLAKSILKQKGEMWRKSEIALFRRFLAKKSEWDFLAGEGSAAEYVGMREMRRRQEADGIPAATHGIADRHRVDVQPYDPIVLDPRALNKLSDDAVRLASIASFILNAGDDVVRLMDREQQQDVGKHSLAHNLVDVLKGNKINKKRTDYIFQSIKDLMDVGMLEEKPKVKKRMNIKAERHEDIRRRALQRMQEEGAAGQPGERMFNVRKACAEVLQSFAARYRNGRRTDDFWDGLDRFYRAFIDRQMDAYRNNDAMEDRPAQQQTAPANAVVAPPAPPPAPAPVNDDSQPAAASGAPSPPPPVQEAAQGVRRSSRVVLPTDQNGLQRRKERMERAQRVYAYTGIWKDLMEQESVQEGGPSIGKYFTKLTFEIPRDDALPFLHVFKGLCKEGSSFQPSSLFQRTDGIRTPAPRRTLSSMMQTKPYGWVLPATFSLGMGMRIVGPKKPRPTPPPVQPTEDPWAAEDESWNVRDSDEGRAKYWFVDWMDRYTRQNMMILEQEEKPVFGIAYRYLRVGSMMDIEELAQESLDVATSMRCAKRLQTIEMCSELTKDGICSVNMLPVVSMLYSDKYGLRNLDGMNYSLPSMQTGETEPDFVFIGEEFAPVAFAYGHDDRIAIVLVDKKIAERAIVDPDEVAPLCVQKGLKHYGPLAYFDMDNISQMLNLQVSETWIVIVYDKYGRMEAMGHNCDTTFLQSAKGRIQRMSMDAFSSGMLDTRERCFTLTEEKLKRIDFNDRTIQGASQRKDAALDAMKNAQKQLDELQAVAEERKRLEDAIKDGTAEIAARKALWENAKKRRIDIPVDEETQKVLDSIVQQEKLIADSKANGIAAREKIDSANKQLEKLGDDAETQDARKELLKIIEEQTKLRNDAKEVYKAASDAKNALITANETPALKEILAASHAVQDANKAWKATKEAQSKAREDLQKLISNEELQARMNELKKTMEKATEVENAANNDEREATATKVDIAVNPNNTEYRENIFLNLNTNERQKSLRLTLRNGETLFAGMQGGKGPGTETGMFEYEKLYETPGNWIRESNGVEDKQSFYILLKMYRRIADRHKRRAATAKKNAPAKRADVGYVQLSSTPMVPADLSFSQMFMAAGGQNDGDDEKKVANEEGEWNTVGGAKKAGNKNNKDNKKGERENRSDMPPPKLPDPDEDIAYSSFVHAANVVVLCCDKYVDDAFPDKPFYNFKVCAIFFLDDTESSGNIINYDLTFDDLMPAKKRDENALTRFMYNPWRNYNRRMDYIVEDMNDLMTKKATWQEDERKEVEKLTRKNAGQNEDDAADNDKEEDAKVDPQKKGMTKAEVAAAVDEADRLASSAAPDVQSTKKIMGQTTAPTSEIEKMHRYERVVRFSKLFAVDMAKFYWDVKSRLGLCKEGEAPPWQGSSENVWEVRGMLDLQKYGELFNDAYSIPAVRFKWEEREMLDELHRDFMYISSEFGSMYIQQDSYEEEVKRIKRRVESIVVPYTRRRQSKEAEIKAYMARVKKERKARKRGKLPSELAPYDEDSYYFSSDEREEKAKEEIKEAKRKQKANERRKKRNAEQSKILREKEAALVESLQNAGKEREKEKREKLEKLENEKKAQAEKKAQTATAQKRGSRDKRKNDDTSKANETAPNDSKEEEKDNAAPKENASVREDAVVIVPAQEDDSKKKEEEKREEIVPEVPPTNYLEAIKARGDKKRAEMEAIKMQKSLEAKRRKEEEEEAAKRKERYETGILAFKKDRNERLERMVKYAYKQGFVFTSMLKNGVHRINVSVNEFQSREEKYHVEVVLDTCNLTFVDWGDNIALNKEEVAGIVGRIMERHTDPSEAEVDQFLRQQQERQARIKAENNNNSVRQELIKSSAQKSQDDRVKRASVSAEKEKQVKTQMTRTATDGEVLPIVPRGGDNYSGGVPGKRKGRSGGGRPRGGGGGRDWGRGMSAGGGGGSNWGSKQPNRMNGNAYHWIGTEGRFRYFSNGKNTLRSYTVKGKTEWQSKKGKKWQKSGSPYGSGGDINEQGDVNRGASRKIVDEEGFEHVGGSKQTKKQQAAAQEQRDINQFRDNTFSGVQLGIRTSFKDEEGIATGAQDGNLKRRCNFTLWGEYEEKKRKIRDFFLDAVGLDWVPEDLPSVELLRCSWNGHLDAVILGDAQSSSGEEGTYDEREGEIMVKERGEDGDEQSVASSRRVTGVPKVVSTVLGIVRQFQGSHEGEAATCICYIPALGCVASGGMDRKIRIMDAEVTLDHVVPPLTRHSSPIRCVAASPDGVLLASGDDSGALIIWRIDQKDPNTCCYKMHLGHGSVLRVAWSPDGKFLAASNRDSTITVLRRYNHVSPVPESNDQAASEQVQQQQQQGGGKKSRVLQTFEFKDSAGAQEGGLQNTNAQSMMHEAGILMRECVILGSHTAHVHCLGWSPDSRTLASAGADGTIRLWSCSHRRAHPMTELTKGCPILAHSDQVWDLRWSPSGNKIATCGKDGYLVVWDVRKIIGYALRHRVP